MRQSSRLLAEQIVDRRVDMVIDLAHFNLFM
jgi:hypothetical protein